MTYSWHESYRAGLLETNGTKMREGIQAAEAKIRDRQRVLSENHGAHSTKGKPLPMPLPGSSFA